MDIPKPIRIMNLKIAVAPNPFATEITVTVHLGFHTTAIVTLLNDEGKILRMASWTLLEGSNKFAFNDLATVPAGVYHVEVNLLDNDHKESVILIKN